jgi:diguanylate cyclase (GGDEF)-like protein
MNEELDRSTQLRILRRRFTRRWVAGVSIGGLLLLVDWVTRTRIVDNASDEAKAVPAVQRTLEDFTTSNNIMSVFAAGVLVAMAFFMFRPLDRTLRRQSRILDEVEAAESREARRQRFGTELHEALEMAENEQGISRVVEHVLGQSMPDNAAELLLADSSEAHLSRCVVHPVAGAAGCEVPMPFECPAVKRATAQTFPSSTAVNACPHLRDREGEARSALCVPVAFMGRSLGVLHITGPDGNPPEAEDADRMSVLAGQVGTAIGTVRAFAKAQLQANTDSLTGLLNRRSAEDQLSRRLGAGESFAVVMADLDHFKLLNDTYGHDAGDRALRMFADTVRRTLRAEDIFARWGGEEFVIALPRTETDAAVEILERVRHALAETCSKAETATVTASFGVADTSMGRYLEDLLRLADGALKTAKMQGRNRVRVAQQVATGDGLDPALFPSGARLRTALPVSVRQSIARPSSITSGKGS